ncbi:MAG: flavodoxin family protein [Candidatus Thorarchaeota archaeon]|nr:flavodoxin family protein [Candidatus Thorarchaeota archaeon]
MSPTLEERFPMKAMILHGSPRKDGNSSTLAMSLAEGLQESGAEHLWNFHVNEMNIAHCQGCMTCSTAEGHICAITDDMQEIRSAFIEADVVIFATPMFWGYMTSQLKTVLDRMEALAVGPEEWWRGKTFVSILTYWYHYETMVSFFERVCPVFGVKYIPLVYCSNVEGVEGDVHVSTQPDKLKEAYELGKSLGSEYMQ